MNERRLIDIYEVDLNSLCGGDVVNGEFSNMNIDIKLSIRFII